jgi:hypothetical protein
LAPPIARGIGGTLGNLSVKRWSLSSVNDPVRQGYMINQTINRLSPIRKKNKPKPAPLSCCRYFISPSRFKNRKKEAILES